MKIDPVSGLLNNAVYMPSPNADERPVGCMEELIVVHNISLPPGVYGSGDIQRFFTNQLDSTKHPYYEQIADLRVSAHILIDRLGDVTQYVPFNKRAWHAGQSNYLGRERCNDFSIGIELEGIDDGPYELLQYKKLVDVIKSLLTAYPTLKTEHITGHSDISPGRKTDPGPSFDWQYLKDELHKTA